MKKTIVLILCLLLVGIVFAYTGVITTFTTGAGVVNLTYTGNSTQYLYVDIPMFTYVQNFTINITGYTQNGT